MLSVLIGILFYGGYRVGFVQGWPLPVSGVISYLGLINWTLAAFNMLPAFPLDGGRILRSILWRSKGSLLRATRISSRIGSAFGILLILLGAASFVTGRFLPGVWWFLIGMFLRNAASMSYQQLLTRRALEGEPISRFMTPDPVTVPAHETIERLVSDYFYKYRFKLYPVTENGSRLVGCVQLERIKEVPREEWAHTDVAAITEPCTTENTIPPDTDAVNALSRMRQTGLSRLLVADAAGRLLGVVTLKDMLKLLALKIELQG
jgi:CBS domain-containing protein